MPSTPVRPFVVTIVVFLSAAASIAQGITGTVVASGGVPVSGAIVHFTGATTPSPTTTDSLGVFIASVPASMYTVDIEPPVLVLAPARIEGVVVVSGTVSLGTIMLAPGFMLTGHVQTQGGSPIVSGDTDVIVEATGQKLYTPNHHTDSAGTSSVVVRPGRCHVEANGPAGHLPVSQASSPFPVAGATNIGTIVRPPGVGFSGTVVNSQTFAALANVDIDVYYTATGTKV